MYLEYYGLREEPFGVTPDPRYLYLSPTHREALASLYYGIQASRGFLSLVARPGMGKTTLLFRLLSQLRNSARTVFVFQTQCDSRDFMRHVLADLEIPTANESMAEMNEKLNALLLAEAKSGRQVVLIIDEAQNLDPTVLETVRMLSNFETPSAKLMQIVLAGQPQLADLLASPGMVQLRQRISIMSRLNPFTPEQTETYIMHRLRIAGCENDLLFTQGALAAIARFGEGVPRNINNLCFNALSLGCAMQRKEIDRAVIEEVVADLKLDTLVSQPAPAAVSASSRAYTPPAPTSIFSPTSAAATRSHAAGGSAPTARPLPVPTALPRSAPPNNLSDTSASSASAPWTPPPAPDSAPRRINRTAIYTVAFLVAAVAIWYFGMRSSEAPVPTPVRQQATTAPAPSNSTSPTSTPSSPATQPPPSQPSATGNSQTAGAAPSATDAQSAAGVATQAAVYLGLGNSYLDRGDYKKALTAFKAGLTLDPSNQTLQQKIAQTIEAQAAEQRVLKH
jgi:general secretion pathway protein A